MRGLGDSTPVSNAREMKMPRRLSSPFLLLLYRGYVAWVIYTYITLTDSPRSVKIARSPGFLLRNSRDEIFSPGHVK